MNSGYPLKKNLKILYSHGLKKYVIFSYKSCSFSVLNFTKK